LAGGRLTWRAERFSWQARSSDIDVLDELPGIVGECSSLLGANKGQAGVAGTDPLGTLLPSPGTGPLRYPR